MKINLYAIYDSASGVYDGPHKGQSDGAILRQFGDMCNNPEHDIGRHPADFTLFFVGTWNDGTGEMVDKTTKKIANGIELVKKVHSIEEYRTGADEEVG